MRVVRPTPDRFDETIGVWDGDDSAVFALDYPKRMGDWGWVAVLGVDSQNPTGATRIYERAGMCVLWRADVWEKELRPGA